jgi:hypothetical protein
MTGMAKTNALDPNRYRLVSNTVTFAGATPNAIGDFDGTGNQVTVFTVTGEVLVRVTAICTTDLVFAANATIELGTAANEIIATTDLTSEGLAAKEIWHDATPDSEIELYSTSREYVITDGNDITLTVGVANVNSGVIAIYCDWRPLSSDGLVAAA